MTETIVFLIFSFGSWLISRVLKKAEKDEFEDRSDAIGTITKKIDTVGGNIMFYVSFINSQGESVEGQSISYSSMRRKFKINESVRIKYHIRKKGRPLVSIIDDDLISCRLGAVKAAKNMKIASIIFFILAVVAFLL